MARAKVGPVRSARDDVRQTALDAAVSGAARVRELERHVDRLAEANRQLAEREARLRDMFEAGPDAVALVAGDGTILDLNPAGRRLLDVEVSSQPLDLRLDMLATDPHRTACRAMATRVFRGEAATVELEIQNLRGRRCWVETHATPLRDESGSVTAIVCTSREITARRLAEAALRDREARWRGVFESPMVGILFWHRSGGITDANDAFLAMVGYSREDLLAGRLSWLEMTPTEERHLDAVALERLAATGVCESFEKHYIRKDGTRVPIVIGGSLADGARDHGVAYVQDISTRRPTDVRADVPPTSAQARHLVEQIPTFEPRQPDERRVIAMREAIEESVRLVRASLPAEVELLTGYSRNVPNVLADRSRIHQVVVNLCTNAWQAIPGGVGRITVSLASVHVAEGQLAGLRPGRYACLTVVDTGCGIDPGIVDRIFDPFFTTKAPGGATGLGLSVVDGIVKSHDGAIAVETVPGQGATFRVYLPGVEVDAAPRPVEGAAPVSGHGQRILYLDDEASLVTLTTRLLGRAGYDVEGFTRPADAIAAFAADPRRFAMVVSDMNMPTASGLSVAADILRLRPDVPVALISGVVTDELTARADALGVRAVIYKPNLTRELAPLIARLLSGG